MKEQCRHAPALFHTRHQALHPLLRVPLALLLRLLLIELLLLGVLLLGVLLPDLFGLLQALLGGLLGSKTAVHAGVEKRTFVAVWCVHGENALLTVLPERACHLVHPLHQWIGGLLLVQGRSNVSALVLVPLAGAAHPGMDTVEGGVVGVRWIVGEQSGGADTDRIRFALAVSPHVVVCRGGC